MRLRTVIKPVVDYAALKYVVGTEEERLRAYRETAEEIRRYQEAQTALHSGLPQLDLDDLDSESSAGSRTARAALLPDPRRSLTTRTLRRSRLVHRSGARDPLARAPPRPAHPRRARAAAGRAGARERPLRRKPAWMTMSGEPRRSSGTLMQRPNREIWPRSTVQLDRPRLRDRPAPAAAARETPRAARAARDRHQRYRPSPPRPPERATLPGRTSPHDDIEQFLVDANCPRSTVPGPNTAPTPRSSTTRPAPLSEGASQPRSRIT